MSMYFPSAMAIAKLATVLVLLVLTFGAGDGALPSDNVSVQWNNMCIQLLCTIPQRVHGANIVQAHMNLAQWHALLALKRAGRCTTEEAVVAYASRAVLAQYFPFYQDDLFDPLLLGQIKALKLSSSQMVLGKRIGEAVAGRLVRHRQPVHEFVLPALRQQWDEASEHPVPGIVRYVPDTPHNASSPLTFSPEAVEQAFLLPDADEFQEKYLGFLKPPAVPSDEWDEAWESLVDVGRRDWPGRTAAMNKTASLYGCPRVNGTFACNAFEVFWIQAATAALPATTPLYDVVTLFAQLAVALHDSEVTFMRAKYTFWFWRPVMAFRTGDARHRPIPDWTPPAYTTTDPEYPSGAAAGSATGATVLQAFFGKKKVGFTIENNGAFGPTCSGSPGVEIGPRRFESFWDAAEETKRGRMYIGAHYNISVEHGSMLGVAVGKYVVKHWAKTVPSGVLPDAEILNFVIEKPKKTGDSSPIRYEV